MPNDDNQLAAALWLAAGGAAGYAAGRYVVAPLLAPRSAHAAPLAVSSTAPASALRPAARPTRALGSGPSGVMQPIDPYAPRALDVVATSTDPLSPPLGAAPQIGPSGDMRPIDPYADTAIAAPTPSSIAPSSVAPTIVSPNIVPASPAPAVDGPITRPSQVSIAMPPTVRGPITRPSQVDATLTIRVPEVATPAVMAPKTTATVELKPVFATKPRVRRFDTVFERYRGELPIEYVRALVERESDGLPNARAGSAIGLMQIVPVVLADYNKRHGTAYRSEHLVDPATNVAIGCDLLRLIVDSYRKHHPRIATLQTDWNNLRFVELLTFGWNAGYSEAGGLGRVARYLEGLGYVDITIDQVSAHAQRAGASKHLSNPAKVAWCKGVAALYQRERALARAAFASS
jgi:hypothetical protein